MEHKLDPEERKNVLLALAEQHKEKLSKENLQYGEYSLEAFLNEMGIINGYRFQGKNLETYLNSDFQPISLSGPAPLLKELLKRQSFNEKDYQNISNTFNETWIDIEASASPALLDYVNYHLDKFIELSAGSWN